MSDDAVKITVDPYRQIRIGKIKDITQLEQKELDLFVETVSRTYKAKKPAKEDLQSIRKYLKEYPALCKAVFAIVDNIQSLFIKGMLGMEAAEIATEEYIVHIRDEMGYYDAPIMEQLIIENIVTCWLHVQYCQSQLAFSVGRDRSITILEFWERRLSMAQRRYLAACESLAKIRKMKVPALQLNIGDKQINVAGNLQPNPK